MFVITTKRGFIVATTMAYLAEHTTIPQAVDTLVRISNNGMTDYAKRCTKCGELKLLSDFYFDKRKGRHEAQCKACKLAYQKERHKLVMQDQNLHHKRLITQSKYRDRYRDKIAKKSRLERRKKGISPQQYVNKKLLLELYAQGFPIEMIAERCNCVPATVKLYAYRNGVRRGHQVAKICPTCDEYPCFVGQENIETNFAEKCKRYKRKNYKLKNKNDYEQQRKQNK